MSANHETAEAWMDAWMNVPKAPGGRLELGRFADPFYFLGLPISWRPNPDQGVDYAPVTVPAGFVTDLASIPRVFWTALPPAGDYAYAAIIHDYLYWTQDRPREEADQILKFAMQDFGIGDVTVALISRTGASNGSKGVGPNQVGEFMYKSPVCSGVFRA